MQTVRALLLSLSVSLLACSVLLAQSFGDLKDLARIKNDVKSKRVSSYDRDGGNDDFLKIPAGTTAELFNVKGAGIITHIWVTVNHDDPLSRRNLILRMYWDGETEPSVQAPLGDFFGQGWGEFYNYVTPYLSAGPGGGRAMVCYFPMPFATGARITLQNDSDTDVQAFYYYVDYEVHPKLEADLGRFHAWWNHRITPADPKGENEWDVLWPQGHNTTGDSNYVFMETTGSGQFVGVNYFVTSPQPMWYGEGDDMFFIDGEKWPASLQGTGTEDYFNMSWCPKELYNHPYYGLARINGETDWLGRSHCYRFHIQDPVRFSKSLRATIEHGHDNTLTLELATVAYWYQSEPHKPFPAIGDRASRTPMPVPTGVEILRWRDAWRKSLGNGQQLWGNEEK